MESPFLPQFEQTWTPYETEASADEAFEAEELLFEGEGGNGYIPDKRKRHTNTVASPCRWISHQRIKGDHIGRLPV